jgi:hypothetical protein
MKVKAIVYPVITTKDWCDPAPPIPLDRDSRAAAIRALHSDGYRIMWRGGTFDELTVTAEELRDSRAGDASVWECERDIGYELPDDAEITKYVVTVYS